MEKKARYLAARRHAKLTQVQLADKVPMSQQMVSKLEKGLTTESAFDVKIALACGIRAEWLDSEEGDMVGAGGAPARPRTGRLESELDEARTAMAALAMAAVRSTPKLAAAFLAELNKVPDADKGLGIGGLIELLEHARANRGAAGRRRRASAVRGSTARKRL